jgi:protein-L-isoaspartate(D-aspartate) O-methyltransferase
LSGHPLAANDEPGFLPLPQIEGPMEDFADARRRMVDSQLRTESVTDHALLAAMGVVPRELFVPSHLRALAYLDRDIPLKEAADSAPPRYLMQSASLARLVQLADISATDRVLVVGCGTGYSTAVLARLAGSVVALEPDPALSAQAVRNLAEFGVQNAEVVVGPLEAGYPSGGKFDAILLDGAVEELPETLFDQLTEGGRLVAVIGYGRTGAATIVTRNDGRFGRRAAFDANVPPLPGFRKPEVFVF